MDIEFRKLTHATDEIAEYFNKWENDSRLVHLIRVNQDQDSLDKRITVTVKDLEEWLRRKQMYMIYLDGQPVGVVEFQVDPELLYRHDVSSAWIGILIGEEDARGKGIGLLALQHVEKEVHAQGLRRMELGVFEFNTNAIRLYQKAGFHEIGRIPDFTFWQGRLWADVRMEKFIEP